jgi:hypothetical protein
MTLELDDHPLSAAYAAILSQGLDGAGEALRILVNEACKIERAQLKFFPEILDHYNAQFPLT